MLRIVGIFTSGVCDGHEQQVALWNVHPFRHRLQQLLRRHPGVDPHAEEGVHGDVHVAERCGTNDTMFVGSGTRTLDPPPPSCDGFTAQLRLKSASHTLAHISLEGFIESLLAP